MSKNRITAIVDQKTRTLIKSSVAANSANKGMGLKGPEPVARIRAREGVAEVAEIVQQEAEITELPQRSRSRLTIKEEE